MLPKDYRLKKRSAFAATYRTGKTLHEGGMTLFIGKRGNDTSVTKFGFVVSKKVHKRAVIRNRIKRQMRESVRLLLKSNKIGNNYLSLIFVASSKLIDKNYKYIDDTIKNLVSKL